MHKIELRTILHSSNCPLLLMHKTNEPGHEKTMWFLGRSDINRTVEAQKMARRWKFWVENVEELYYPCSENKGTYQICSYCEAVLRLCVRICNLKVFS